MTGGQDHAGARVASAFADAHHLNWDVPADRAVLQRRSWSSRALLLVFDEIHKMPDWTAWLKGVVDARADGRALLVTGNTLTETFRQPGEPLACCCQQALFAG